MMKHKGFLSTNGTALGVRSKAFQATPFQKYTEVSPQLLEKRVIENPSALSSLLQENDSDAACLLFYGIRGKGKTLSMTTLARYIYEMNVPVDSNYKVWSNYNVSFAEADANLINLVLDYPEWLHDGMLLVTEIATAFPSMRASSNNSLNWSTFLQQVRKRNVDILMDTQFPWMVTGGSNTQINAFIRTTLFNYEKVWWARKPLANSVRWDIVDWNGYHTEQPIQHQWPPHESDFWFSCNIHDLIHSGVYRMYDTKEVTNTLWSHASKESGVKGLAASLIADEYTPLAAILHRFNRFGINSMTQLIEVLKSEGFEIGTNDHAKGNAKWYARQPSNEFHEPDQATP